MLLGFAKEVPRRLKGERPAWWENKRTACHPRRGLSISAGGERGHLHVREGTAMREVQRQGSEAEELEDFGKKSNRLAPGPVLI